MVNLGLVQLCFQERHFKRIKYMNLTKKQIDIIIKHTPPALKGKSMSLYSTLGYCTPSYANWSYCAGFVEYKGIKVLVVTRFGQIM